MINLDAPFCVIFKFAPYNKIHRIVKKDSIFSLTLVNNITWKRWACGKMAIFSRVQGVADSFFIVPLTEQSIERMFFPGPHCHA